MDRMLYIAMSGAKQAMEQQASAAHNMANVSTPGFRAQINAFRAVPVQGEEARTRAFVVATTPGADFSHGPVTQTGRALDVALDGDGWLAVQAPDGSEAYTRVGNLQVGADGQLLTMGGLPVLGDGGPLAVPPGAEAQVGSDGTITARGAGDPLTGVADVGKLKLVNPAATDLVRGDDGLFRMRPGLQPAETDAAVRVTSGAIEGSNVNPVQAMVEMISNARAFELQMKSINSANEGAQSANRLLSYGG